MATKVPPLETGSLPELNVWSEGVDPNIEHVLKQYELALASSYQVSAWRQATNKFFVIVATGVASALGWLQKTGGESGLFASACAVGAFVCVAWFLLIAYHRTLNGAKFDVIHEIEKKLPVRFFAAEWEALKRGTSWRHHLPLSKVESFLPVVVGVSFAGLGLAKVLGWM